MNVANEIIYKTTPSGGKGGQNVNKVETAVLASFNIEKSLILSAAQKTILLQKLSKRMNAEGFLQVKSQTYRTQLQNKEDAAKKMNELIKKSLAKKKMRIPTKTTKAANEKRIDRKKKDGQLKASRKKYRKEE